MSDIYHGEGKPLETFSMPEGVKYSHSAIQRVYCKRTVEGFVEKYEGRFGSGFKIHKPYWKSSAYHRIEYWLY